MVYLRFFIVWISLLYAVFPVQVYGQSLPAERKCDWHLAGVRDSSTHDYVLVQAKDHGLISDGNTANDPALSALFSAFQGIPVIIQFEPGIFLFQKEIVLPAYCVLRGQGANLSQLKIEHSGSGNGILIKGKGKLSDTTSVIKKAVLGSSEISVNSANGFEANDWVQFIQNDTALMSNDWAYGSYGQIVQIESIQGGKIKLRDRLRLEISPDHGANMVRLAMIEGSGVECLQIKRMDNTAPIQTSTIHMEYAANCWVKGVQSDSCTFAHVRINSSSRIGICQSLFQHGFEYGGGGRAYGIAVEFTSGDCRIENNVLQHLRHAVLCQAGANGNVFAYNACYLSFWDSVSLPADAAGDLVLHGNYPFLNLFEQNLCQNIVIDNSHGSNGPNNTFLRNRAEKWGVFFSDGDSPGQNILGNEITNTQLPYSLVNYRILGDDHYLYGNLVRGNTQPTGTGNLADSSFAYLSIPLFVNRDQWLSYGLPGTSLDGEIPAGIRWDSQNAIAYCSPDTQTMDSIPSSMNSIQDQHFSIYPNPAKDKIQIMSSGYFNAYKLTSMEGKILDQEIFEATIDREVLLPGCHSVYFITLYFIDGGSRTMKVLKFGG